VAKTVDGLLREFGLEHIDILKIDIEGAELEVFSYTSAWIDKVEAIIIELHAVARQLHASRGLTAAHPLFAA